MSLLKKSFAHLRWVIEGLKENELAMEAEFFGQKTTRMSVYFLVANHLHEHLGQAVAYARSNGVIPPWSKKSDN